MRMFKYNEHYTKMVIGITGCIGSGKTTVAKIFERLGARIIDADSVGHRVIEENDIKKALIKEFGEEILSKDGKIDRKLLGDIVFSSKEKVLTLNRITHPRILDEIAKIISDSSGEMIVVVAPFLIETGIIVDKTILVTTERERIIERLKMAGWNEKDIKQRMKFHPADTERMKNAQIVINNNGTLSNTEARLKRILDEIQGI